MKPLILSVLSILFLAISLGAAEKPNLVLIISDDCTHRDLGCYGGQAITPNIDRLATEGMRFERCFQAAPMCSPTRHNLYTGIYPVKTGAYPNHTFAKDGTKSIVHHLQPLGYRVAQTGKKHISPKEVFPFEDLGGGNNPDMDNVDAFFAENAKADTPFCLIACSNEPHTPWDKGDPSQYPSDKVILPPYIVDTPTVREEFPKYLAEITYFDGQVGEIDALLKKHNLADNTLFMMVSEQGNSLPFAKWTCYDSGLQSAMIARWPGKVEAGSVAKAMVEYVDVTPTFVSAAGGEPISPVDGKSFLPVLLGETDHHKDFVFGVMTTRGIINGSDAYAIRSIRDDRYKLILNLNHDSTFTNALTKSKEFQSMVEKAESGDEAAKQLVNKYQHRPAVELYDIKGDPLEMTNIADNPENTSIIEKLRAELEGWMESQGDEGVATELEALDHQARNRGGKKKNKGKEGKAKKKKKE